MGMINAAVFPEPVCAPPTTSLPRRATGIVLAWIGVGAAKPIEDMPFRIGRDKENVWKDELAVVELVELRVGTGVGSSGAKNAFLRSSSAASMLPASDSESEAISSGCGTAEA